MARSLPGNPQHSAYSHDQSVLALLLATSPIIHETVRHLEPAPAPILFLQVDLARAEYDGIHAQLERALTAVDGL